MSVIYYTKFSPYFGAVPYQGGSGVNYIRQGKESCKTIILCRWQLKLALVHLLTLFVKWVTFSEILAGKIFFFFSHTP